MPGTPTTSNTIAVVSNPTAGKGRGLRAGALVTRRLADAGHQVVDLTSESAAEARDRALAAVAAGVEALVVVGGDGMAHLGVGVCAGTKVPLGIIAAGTGNDIARGLGLPVGNIEESVAAVRTALAGTDLTLQRRQVDAVRVGCPWGPAWFAGVLSAGFDAIVNERANGWAWPRGRMRYNLAVARELPVFKPLRYRIEVDGVSEDISAMLVAVANAPSFGGGMRITPDARMDDGLLEVFVLRPLPLVEFLRLFPKVFSGSHVDHPAVSIRRAERVRIETLDKPVVAYADGERLAGLPLEAEIVSQALTVLAPLPAR